MRCTDTCCRPEHDDIEYLVLGRRWIKAARKPHTCGNCGQQIPAGSPCQRIVALMDGDFYSEYRHPGYGCPASYGEVG